jgi:hypothetical protein
MPGVILAIAGPYTGTWGPTPEVIGVTEDGYELEHTFYSEPVRGDNLGDSIQDEIHRGQDVYVNFTLMEFASAALVQSSGHVESSIFWPFDDSGFNAVGGAGQVGVTGDSRGEYAAPLILTAVANTPASANPATITFYNALLAANFPVRILYASRVRRIPMRMIVYPYTSTYSPGANSYNQDNFYYTTT